MLFIPKMLPLIAAGLAICEEESEKKKNGFSTNTVAYSLILSCLLIIELIWTTAFRQQDAIFYAVFIAVLMLGRIFIWGNVICFATGFPPYAIQQVLEEILIDNKIEYTISRDEENKVISIKNKLQSIVVKAERSNSDRKTVAFRGTWSGKQFKRLSRELIKRIKDDVISK